MILDFLERFESFFIGSIAGFSLGLITIDHQPFIGSLILIESIVLAILRLKRVTEGRDRSRRRK